MSIRIGVCGASGRVGRAITEACQSDADFSVAGALVAPGNDAVGTDAGLLAGVGNLGVKVVAEIGEMIADIDVAIDFTNPAAALASLDACVREAKPLVIGTTGFSAEQRDAIQDLANRLPVVLGPNMSVGVNVCFRLLDVAARALGEDVDIEIIEAHHRNKVDAPSGTAVRMGEVVADALGRDLSQCAVYGREGHTGVRDRTTIGFETVRGGDIVGEHTVLFAGVGERVEITHRSSSRMNFAQGALRAARWVMSKDNGLFDMQDVLGLRS